MCKHALEPAHRTEEGALNCDQVGGNTVLLGCGGRVCQGGDPASDLVE